MTESELLKRFDEQSTADIGIFISQALTTFPGYDKFRIKSAQFYMQLGSYARSRQILTDHSTRPLSKELHLLLAEVELHNDKVQESVKLINSYIKRYPKHFKGQYLKAKIHLKSDEIESAKKSLKKSLELNPAAIAPFKALFELLLNDNTLEEAHALVLSNSELKHIEGKALRRMKLKLARKLLDNQIYEGSLEIVNQLLDENQDDKFALLQKGTIYSKLGKDKEASKIFQKLLKNHPSNPWAYLKLAQITYSEGQVEEALELLDIGIDRASDNIRIIHKKADYLIKLGRYSEVIEFLNHHQKNDSNYMNFQMILIKAFLRRGDFEMSKKELLLLLNADSNIEWTNRIKELLAIIAFKEYDYNASKQLYRDIIVSSTNTINLRQRLCLLLLLEGDHIGAAEELKLATEEIESSNVSGKVGVPLIGHASRILNEVNLHPTLKLKIRSSFGLQGIKRLKYLAEIQLNAPSYFGSALYLINELRKQNLFGILKLSDFKNGQAQIPKTIVQYWDKSKPPQIIRQIMDTWQEMNPDYTYKLFSRNSAYYFIKYNYGMECARAFESCVHPAMQADFFRLAYLNKKGGFYADADDKATKSLESLRSLRTEMTLKYGDFGCIGNNFIGVAPNNKLIDYAFQRGLYNVGSYFNEGPWFKLGPGHLTTCICFFLSKSILNNDFDELKRILVLNQVEYSKYFHQHLSLPYKSGHNSWYASEYLREIRKKNSTIGRNTRIST